MPVESGMHELFVVCLQQPHRAATRRDFCKKIGRLLAAGARRVAVREEASMLLSEINEFADEDIRRARLQAWIHFQYSQSRPTTPGAQRPFVGAEMAFINDWIESSDESEAMRRAVVRAGGPLQPPGDFHLAEASYANLEKARANGRAKVE